MYSAITTHEFTDAILSGSIKSKFEQTVKASEKKWKALGFKEETTTKPFEEYVEIAGLGLPSERLELQQAPFDSIKVGATTRLNLLSYGINMAVAKEAQRNKRINQILKGAKSVADSLATALEILAADVYSNAFSTTTQLLPDGYCICSASHLDPRGNTFSTYLGSTSFTESSIEAALIAAEKMASSTGIPTGVKPKAIVVPPEYKFEARRILQSPQQSHTGNNAINALKDDNLKPEINRYLSSTSNWFVVNDVENGLVCLWGEKPNVVEVGQDLNRASIWSGNMMVAFGCAGNPRVLLGSDV